MSTAQGVIASERRDGGRYVIFLVVIAVSALSPAMPDLTPPEPSWWLVAVAFLLLMMLAGWLGSRHPRSQWLHSIAPLLLFPAIYALRCSDGDGASGFSPLILLPVVWFALYGRMRDVVLAVVLGTATLLVPLVFVGPPQYPGTSWRGTVLLIVIAAALGPLIHRLVESTRRANYAVRRSEVEFRAAFEDAPVGMAISGLRGPDAERFVRVNRALCEIFGRDAQELTAVPISTFTHPDDVEITHRGVLARAESGAPQRVEKRYLHKSGRTIWASVSFSVIRDEDGNPSHLITQIADVGSQRDYDQALLDAFETDREATEQLRRLDRIRSELASTVSHELRTPLTSAAGYVELLAEGDAGPLTEEQRTMLDTIARNLTRLDGIVDDVLGMTNADRSRRRDFGTADLGMVLTGAVSSVALQAATRGQDLITHNDLTGVHVVGDAGRLERVLVNLLTNALKFTGEDGTITVTATSDDTRAMISVTDTGIGISPNDQKRIFERFFRADRGVASAASGTGLGLSIVKTITTQYGGEVTVSSELGKGSTFTLTLPLQTTLAG
jgi:PAS domain S-box-containing protein